MYLCPSLVVLPTAYFICVWHDLHQRFSIPRRLLKKLEHFLLYAHSRLTSLCYCMLPQQSMYVAKDVRRASVHYNLIWSITEPIPNRPRLHCDAPEKRLISTPLLQTRGWHFFGNLTGHGNKQNRYESRDWDGRGKNLIGSGRDRE